KKDAPLPLVIACHGLGGTENLFFEGYGRGAIVRLCRERGWLLAAPRCPGPGRLPPLDEIVDEIAKLYPADRKHVYLIGHSLGAIQAIEIAVQKPECFAGVAALAGGGAVQASAALERLPFFVGVGSEDFLLAAARKLHQNLEKAGVRQVRFREYP